MADRVLQHSGGDDAVCHYHCGLLWLRAGVELDAIKPILRCWIFQIETAAAELSRP
jgi:hypothetical protein